MLTSADKNLAKFYYVFHFWDAREASWMQLVREGTRRVAEIAGHQVSGTPSIQKLCDITEELATSEFAFFLLGSGIRQQCAGRGAPFTTRTSDGMTAIQDEPAPGFLVCYTAMVLSCENTLCCQRHREKARQHRREMGDRLIGLGLEKLIKDPGPGVRLVDYQDVIKFRYKLWFSPDGTPLRDEVLIFVPRSSGLKIDVVSEAKARFEPLFNSLRHRTIHFARPAALACVRCGLRLEHGDGSKQVFLGLNLNSSEGFQCEILRRDVLACDEKNKSCWRKAKELSRRGIVCLNCHASGSTTKLKLCFGCRVAYYCSPACQKNHWGIHKDVCRAIAKQVAARERRRQADDWRVLHVKSVEKRLIDYRFNARAGAVPCRRSLRRIEPLSPAEVNAWNQNRSSHTQPI